MVPKGDGDLSPQAAHKYGPSAVRDVHYVTGTKQSYVQVKQRKNGQYVVVERLPVHYHLRNHGLPSLHQSLAESGLRSIKPDWVQTLMIRDSELKNSFLSLPPIDLGWREKAQPLVGSLVNVHHEPGGGCKSIPHHKLVWDAKAKVGSLDNLSYRSPGRADTTRSDPAISAEASPRYRAMGNMGSLAPNMHYTPGGTEIFTRPHRYEHVKPRVRSLDNLAHEPGGGNVTIVNHPTKWTAQPKVGSLENLHHVPKGGDVSIISERLTWLAKARVRSLENIDYRPRSNHVRMPYKKMVWVGQARVGSLDNIHYRPGGGLVNITNNRLRWIAQPKIDTKPPRRRRKSLASTLDSLNSIED